MGPALHPCHPTHPLLFSSNRIRARYPWTLAYPVPILVESFSFLPTSNMPNALPPLLMSLPCPSRISKHEKLFLLSSISNYIRPLCGLVELVSLLSVLTEPVLSPLVRLMYSSPPRRRHPPPFLMEDRHSTSRSSCACTCLTLTMTTTARLAPSRTVY